MVRAFPAITVLIGALVLLIFAFQCSINWEGEVNDYLTNEQSQQGGN